MNKNLSRRAVLLSQAALAVALATGTAAASAQAWPTQPVRWFIPFPAGGATDVLTRMLAREVEKNIGQPVIVENRAGGNTNIAVQALMQAKPDGHTFMVAANDTMTINPHLFRNAPDPEQSFEYACQWGEYVPALLVAKKDFPANDAKQAMEYLRKNASTVNYASHGTGSVSQIRMELLLGKLGIKLNHVPYKGSAPALQDIAGGQVDILVDSRTNSLPLIKSGQVKAIAVMGAQRYPDMPDVMTLAEAGTSAGDFATFQAFVAPKGTPPAIVAQFSEAVRKAVDNRELKDAFAARGFTSRYRSPAEFRKHVADESAAMKKVIADNNITAGN